MHIQCILFNASLLVVILEELVFYSPTQKVWYSGKKTCLESKKFGFELH